MGLNIEEQKAVERFRQQVIDPSMTKLVILDFYADWCGPCKALAPVLEKVVGEYAEKGVVLAKIDVDKEKFIASQFQVQSIPKVYALFQGQPVADLTNARSESQLRSALDQLLAQLPVKADAEGAAGGADVAQFVEMAEAVLGEGDAQRAAGIFAQVIELDPENARAHAGLVRALVEAGEIDRAREALAKAETIETVKADEALAPARTALQLAANRVDEGELEQLRAKARANPADMETQFALAEAAYAAGARDEAAQILLDMVRSDRDWNDGAARAKLLQIFEAVGLEDPWVIEQRRKLSRILFG